MKTITFIRDFIQFSGGHLKVFHYYNHVAHSGVFRPILTLTPRSRRDGTNPWTLAGVPFSETIGTTDAYFVAGLDWDILDRAGVDLRGRTVINLVQHVRHASPQDARYRFLGRPALRICVSQEVADAVRETGVVNGEVVTIPNGIDLDSFGALRDTPKVQDVFIGGLKAPKLALDCAKILKKSGLTVSISTESLPRAEYIRRVAEARIALLLPHSTEGFYLPALEAMASKVCVVVPDCVGNRSFCLPGINCIMPPYRLEDLTQAVLGLVKEPERQAALRSQALRMAADHGLDVERARVRAVLERLAQGA